MLCHAVILCVMLCGDIMCDALCVVVCDGVCYVVCDSVSDVVCVGVVE